MSGRPVADALETIMDWVGDYALPVLVIGALLVIVAGAIFGGISFICWAIGAQP